MWTAISRWYFGRKGWQVTNGLPSDLKKCVVVAAPHTSNWDFVFARGAFFIIGTPVKYVIKKEMMFFPLGLLLGSLGAISVNRKKQENFTDRMVRLFVESEQLHLMIAPEGTRSKVSRWKTGFYHIALEAGVPIALGFLDYEKKLAGFGPIFYPTGDKEADFKAVREFYQTITPCHPDNYEVALYP
jgi:1-acyl-sn-glycerol-3-phosphate acyltransferase